MTIQMNPSEVDQEIIRLTEKLEERVEDFAVAARAAAEAEARWKYRSSRVLLDIIETHHGRKTTVQEREARVEVECADEHSAMLITAATSKSVKEAINAMRVQIDALRTIAANLRVMTGSNF